MTNSAFVAHLDACEKLLDGSQVGGDRRGDGASQSYSGQHAKFLFAPQRSEPGVRPQAGEHLFVRVGKEVVGWHHIIGTNRAFEADGRTPRGWQVLYHPLFHELDEPLPAPSHKTFSTIALGDPA